MSTIKASPLAGVLAPGGRLMEIMPTGDCVLAEARIKPADIDSMPRPMPKSREAFTDR